MTTDKLKLNNEDLPSLFKAADASSMKAQGLFKRLFLTNLVCIVLIPILALISHYFLLEHKKILFSIIGILFIGSLMLTILVRLKKWENSWYNSRAIAESIKSMTWRYITCSEPFNVEIDRQEIDNRFLQLMKKLLEEIKDDNVLRGGTFGTSGQISEKMRLIRTSNLTQRKAIYLESRIFDQRAWYSHKAKSNQRKVNLFFIILIICQVAGIISSFLLVQNPGLPISVISIFAALASSLLAWLQVMKHQELSQAYTVAAQDLGLIQEKESYVTDDAQLSVFVSDAETAISREHTMWLARRDIYDYKKMV